MGRGAAVALVALAGGCAVGGTSSLISWQAGHVPGWAVALSVPAGGVVMLAASRLPATVTVLLSAVPALLVPAPVADTAQVLVLPALGVVAYHASWRLIVPVALVVWVATACNLTLLGAASTMAVVTWSALFAGLPVLVGGYLRTYSRDDRTERALLLDLLLAGGGVAFVVLTTWPYWHEGPLPLWGAGWFAITSGLSAGLVRGLPGVAFAMQAVFLLVAESAAGFVADALQGMIGVTLGVFAMRASWLWTLVAYLVACAVTAVNVVDGSWESATPSRVVALMLMVATPVMIGRYLRGRQAAAELERTMAREAEELTAARLRADRLAERERIARDVHDIVAHHVGAMVLRAGAAQYAGPPGPVKEALADIRATGHQVLEDLRGLLEVVRAPDAESPPLADPADIVRDAVERVSAAGLRVEFHMDPQEAEAPLVARTSAARIVQEGLTNALKHAGPGTTVTVGVAAVAGALRVEVRNGPAAAPPERLPSTGQGIAGMRERVRALGGRLTAGPTPDGGWSLTATLPVRSTAALIVAHPADPGGSCRPWGTERWGA
jgi:signal transduction histidine kinase